MTKLLPLCLLLTACVDAPAVDAVALEGKIEPPLVGEAGLKGEYLMRGHGITGNGGANWHVGLVGTLSVSGASAAIAYRHPYSSIRTDGRYTRPDACVVTVDATLPRFGEINCVLERGDRREELKVDYVVSPDGNRVVLEGSVAMYRLAALSSGETYWNNVESSTMNFEATR